MSTKRRLPFVTISALMLVVLFATAALAGIVTISRFSSRTIQKPGYDSYPSVFHDAGYDHYFWCQPGTSIDGKAGDAIAMKRKNLSTGAWEDYGIVFRANTTGAWDSGHVCDPTVVRGNWVINGKTYLWAMYYAGNKRLADGTVNDFRNQVGVVFTTNVLNWSSSTYAYRHPSPVVTNTQTENVYGAGMPSAYKPTTGSDVKLFYTDTNPDWGARSYSRTSSDGINFSARTEVSCRGHADPYVTNADYAYDPGAGRWYRAESEGSADQTQHFIKLERISSSALNKGASTLNWEGKGTVELANSGEPMQNNPGFRRDYYGNIYGSPATMYWGAGQMDSGTWDIQGGTFSTTSSGWGSVNEGSCS